MENTYSDREAGGIGRSRGEMTRDGSSLNNGLFECCVG